MICSSEFSLDENSVWDPKAIRQLLVISEDQLNILNNIPEWTKENENYYSRIRVNNSCINTQVGTNTSHSLLKNQEIINHNIELFNEDSDFRLKIIEAHNLNALKFSKSISLFEINKIGKNSQCDNHLSPALSLPNLSVFSRDFNTQFENKSYLRKKSDLLPRLNLAIFSTGKSKSCVENLNMEVVSQLPAVVPQIIKSSENFAIVDKSISSTNQTIQSSDSSSNSCDLLSTLVNVNRSDNLSSIATEKTILVETNTFNSGDEDITSSKKQQITVSNNKNTDLQENTVKLSEQTDFNLHKKMETDTSIVRESIVNTDSICNTSKKINPEGLDASKKNELQVTLEENLINNASSSNNDKYSNINTENKIPNKINETSVEISKYPIENELQVTVKENVINKDEIPIIDVESKILNETSVETSKQPIVDPKLCESKVNVISSDELKSKIIDSLQGSKTNAEIVLKTACRGAGDGETVTSQNLSLKRKSESKARSSKRSKSSKDKQGCSDERSIKRTGEVCYCPEDITIMFDLLKLFL